MYQQKQLEKKNNEWKIGVRIQSKAERERDAVRCEDNNDDYIIITHAQIMVLEPETKCNTITRRA